MGIDRIVYDVEVVRGPKETEKGWADPEGMGFASAVTYSYNDDLYRFWLGPDDLTPLLKYLAGKTAITFNGIKFDSKVILGNDRVLTDDGRTSLTAKEDEEIWFDNYDILQEYMKGRYSLKSAMEIENALDHVKHDGSFSLDGMAGVILGLKKSGSGSQAPVLYKEKKYAELLAYNLQDVRLTRKIYDFIEKNGFVVDAAGRMFEL